jgi:hypothetical protein
LNSGKKETEQEAGNNEQHKHLAAKEPPAWRIFRRFLALIALGPYR